MEQAREFDAREYELFSTLTKAELDLVSRLAKPLQVPYAEKLLADRPVYQVPPADWEPPEYVWEQEESWMSIEELEALPPVQWLLKGYIPKGGFCELVAESGAGKSGVALDWAFRLANEGHKVLYVAAEGGNGLGGRARAWKKAHNSTIVSANIAFLKPAFIPNLSEAESVRAMVDRLSIEWRDKYDLVILDTFAQMFSEDENAAKDVGVAIKACAEIQRSSGAAVLLVHHTGWDKTRQRGSSAIYAACDAVIQMEVVDSDEQISKVYVQKMKDGEKGKPYWVQTYAPDTSTPEASDECAIQRVDAPPDKTALDEQERILEALETWEDPKKGPTPTNIAKVVSMGRAKVEAHLSALALAGKAKTQEGTTHWVPAQGA